MATVNMEVDLYADLDDKGVNMSLYFADNCEPSIEKLISWEQIMTQQIEYATIPSQLCIPYNEIEDLNEYFNLVRTLRAVADNLEERLMSLDALDRKAWLEANNGNYGGDREPFIKPIKELLNGIN